MLKRTLIALAIVLCTLPLEAREWRLVVGVMGKFDFVTDGLDLNPSGWWVDRFDRGTQFDAGIRTGKHEAYLAYHLSHSSEESDYNSTTVRVRQDSLTWRYAYSGSREWQSAKRILAGYRFWPVGVDYPVVPVLGAALGYGWTSVRRSYFYREELLVEDPETHSITDSTIGRFNSFGHKDSDADWDGLLEAGVAVRLYQDLELLALSQIHTHLTKFPEAFDLLLAGPNWKSNGVFTFALGLRYTLR